MIFRSTKYFLFLFSLIIFSSATAQLPITIEVKLDTGAIRIGEQTTYHIKIRYEKKRIYHIAWPVLKDSLCKGIEIIKTKNFVDTTISNYNKEDYITTKDYVITSFDEGNYLIPSFKFILNNDSNQFIETNPLPLRVRTVDVDTTADIKDIKPPYHEPLNFEDFVTYIWIAAGIAIAAIIFYFFRRYMKHKREMDRLAHLSKPSHEIALLELGKLKKDKIWKKGAEQTKEHHTLVSEIVRTFLERNFSMNAMEMTTYDILMEIENKSITKESKAILKNVLYLTDMVKFAKEIPNDLQNEVVVDDAVRFVKNNIPSEATEKEI